MKKTDNYNLNKPEPNDYINVKDLNENADSIDKELQSNHNNLDNHKKDKNNPHSVTAEDVGLNNLKNSNQATKKEFDQHKNNIDNPHNVNKSDVGLGNVENVPPSDIRKDRSKGLVVEVRSSDPSNPETGRIWLKG